MADNQFYPSGIYPGGTPDRFNVAKNQEPNDGDDPSVQSNAYNQMEMAWEPIKANVLGTQYFRSRAVIYLPQEPREEPDAWRRRYSHAVMSPFLQRLVDQAAGLMLRKKIQLEPKNGAESVNPFWDEFILDVDGFGADLNAFSRRLVVDSLLYGHAGLLVDHNAVELPRSLAEERALALRPYFVGPITADSILGWRKSADDPLAPIELVRLLETVEEPKGRFGVEVLEQVRVLYAGKYEIWREAENGWYLHQEGETSLDQIPLCVTYSNKVAELVSKPPLLPIANLGILHAQRQADLQFALHVSAMPILVLKAWDDEDSKVGLSANSAIILPPEGNAEYVEPASGSFQAQADFIASLEEQMSNLGISTLFSQKNTAETAESKQLSRTDSDSLLQLISKDVEATLQKAFELVAQYTGIDAPKVKIDRDFDLQVLSDGQVSQFLSLWQNGAICHETLLEALKTGEVLPHVDVEEELERCAQESLLTGDLGLATGDLPTEDTVEIAAGDGVSEVRAAVEERLKAMAKQKKADAEQGS